MGLRWTAAIEQAEVAVAAWRGCVRAAPGGAVLLFDAEGVRGEATAGSASLPHALPFTARTRARYASITKHVFCAFALAHGFDIDAPLGRYLPGLAPVFAALPVRRALSMTGALPDPLQSYTLCGLPLSTVIPLDALDDFCDGLAALNADPGTEIAYSNTGYRLAERAMAAVGLSFGDWVEGPVNFALGTSLRFPRGWDRPLEAMAEGYWREGAEAPWRTGFYGPGLSASGALTGSAHDLALWLAALLRGDGPAGDVVARLAAPTAMADGRMSGYGLGLVHDRLGRHDLLGHGGSLPGFKNEILFDLRQRAGVVVLSNREDTDPQVIARRVMAALLDEPLPVAAPPTGMPQGLFVEENGPHWIELAGSSLTYLGSNDAVEAGAGPGEAVSSSPYMPVRLVRDGDGVSGEIGFAARRFRPAPRDATLPADMAGVWRADRQNATLVIDIAPDGSGSASLGIGPLHRPVPLVPLGGARALMAVGAMPWPSRACVWLDQPDRLGIATHRSRVMRYRRIGGHP